VTGLNQVKIIGPLQDDLKLAGQPQEGDGMDKIIKSMHMQAK